MEKTPSEEFLDNIFNKFKESLDTYDFDSARKYFDIFDGLIDVWEKLHSIELEPNNKKDNE